MIRLRAKQSKQGQNLTTKPGAIHLSEAEEKVYEHLDLAVAEFAIISRRMAEDVQTSQLVPFFIPSLGATLLAVEEAKGSPLTEDEVIKIRDHSKCVLITDEIASEMEAERGYKDLSPEKCWIEYLELKAQLGDT